MTAFLECIQIPFYDLIATHEMYENKGNQVHMAKMPDGKLTLDKSFYDDHANQVCPMILSFPVSWI
jgi:hypothetical protein